MESFIPTIVSRWQVPVAILGPPRAHSSSLATLGALISGQFTSWKPTRSVQYDSLRKAPVDLLRSRKIRKDFITVFQQNRPIAPPPRPGPRQYKSSWSESRKFWATQDFRRSFVHGFALKATSDGPRRLILWRHAKPGWRHGCWSRETRWGPTEQAVDKLFGHYEDWTPQLCLHGDDKISRKTMKIIKNKEILQYLKKHLELSGPEADKLTLDRPPGKIESPLNGLNLNIPTILRGKMSREIMKLTQDKEFLQYFKKAVKPSEPEADNFALDELHGKFESSSNGLDLNIRTIVDNDISREPVKLDRLQERIERNLNDVNFYERTILVMARDEGKSFENVVNLLTDKKLPKHAGNVPFVALLQSHNSFSWSKDQLLNLGGWDLHDVNVASEGESKNRG